MIRLCLRVCDVMCRNASRGKDPEPERLTQVQSQSQPVASTPAAKAASSLANTDATRARAKRIAHVVTRELLEFFTKHRPSPPTGPV